MSPTRSLVLSSTASTATAAAAYGVLRLVGATAAAASIQASVFAAAAFVIAAIAIRIAAKSFTTEASAAVVGCGAAMIGAFMATSHASDAFGFLFAGFFLGIAISVFALLKDLDEKTSPKLLLFVPMTQLVVLLWVFGL